MAKDILEEGDRLISVWTTALEEGGFPGGGKVGHNNVHSITVQRLPGPTGYYLVAEIIRDNGAADEIVPLHMAQTFEIQNVRV